MRFELDNDLDRPRNDDRLRDAGSNALRTGRDAIRRRLYERMNANHGEPLHVWRMDFAARNGSGRWLEHLTANFSIASEWPPCTTWSGPEGNYPGGCSGRTASSSCRSLTEWSRAVRSATRCSC